MATSSRPLLLLPLLPFLFFFLFLVHVLALPVAFSMPTEDSSTVARNHDVRPLPSGPLVIGYAHDTRRVERAIRDGVNVVCWSFLDMVADDGDSEKGEHSRAMFRTDLDLDAIRLIRHNDEFRHVVHIASIGGWNGPHPPPGVATGKEWCNAFAAFNSDHGMLFDGIDWDLEGHDDRSGPTSVFDLETLDVMGDFSVEAKSRGYVVAMAPAESYLDALAAPDSSFSLSLNLFPRSWTDPSDRALVEQAGFAHAGMQCYAYVLRRAGIESFDWIGLQLYEAYSPFVHETTRGTRQTVEMGKETSMTATATWPKELVTSQADALVRRAEALLSGFDVDLPTYGRSIIRVPLNKLVFGVANGWADGTKFCRVDPRALWDARDILMEAHGGKAQRGVMFWTIDEEKDEKSSSNSNEDSVSRRARMAPLLVEAQKGPSGGRKLNEL